MESPDPYRDAVLSVLPDGLKDELAKAEGQYRSDLAEALAAKGRALEMIRGGKMDRPFEVLEHAALVKYHADKFTKKVRWILEPYRDTQPVNVSPG